MSGDSAIPFVNINKMNKLIIEIIYCNSTKMYSAYSNIPGVHMQHEKFEGLLDMLKAVSIMYKGEIDEVLFC